MSSTARWEGDGVDSLRFTPVSDLAAMDRGATPGWPHGGKAAARYIEEVAPLLDDLQERLFAASRTGDERRILIVAQGLDTAGKGGLARHVMGLVDPQGVHLTAFKKPTEEEASHHFLWRIRRALPAAGQIGFFDRSHYEDLLVPGVNNALDQRAWDERVAEIADFERELQEQGYTLIKVALMVSYEEQGLRLLSRVDRPDKHWKFSTNDLDVRGQWYLYQNIYQRMLRDTSTENAPWHVIPANNKWYSQLALTQLLLRALAEMDLGWPEADYDEESARQRIRSSLREDTLERYDSAMSGKKNRVRQHTDTVMALAREYTGLAPAPTDVDNSEHK